MKGVIFYISSTGNTKLVCEYIAYKIRSVEFERIDLRNAATVRLQDYSIIGFAFPTFHMGTGEAFEQFLRGLEDGRSVPCFLINTYGMMQGRGLKTSARILSGKNFRVVAWHALMMPESYPPFRAKGMTGEGQPKEDQWASFAGFVDSLEQLAGEIGKGSEPEVSRVRIGLFNRLIASKSVERIRREMGEWHADKAACSKCGDCSEVCPNRAIEWNGGPVFDRVKCRGCWTCFNHCPQKAISIGGVSGAFQYCGPGTELIDRSAPGIAER